MRTLIGTPLAIIVACGFCTSARSADDPKAIVDKAIQAMGGEAKFSAAKGFTWKTKGKFIFGDNESKFTAETTTAGLDKHRGEFEGDFGGNTVKGLVVINGDKAWRRFGDMTMELSGDDVTNEKRTAYLQSIPAGLLLPLKSKDFKLEAAGDEKVGDADASAVKVTGPDAKTFTLYFDKTTNLPVKVTATVRGFDGSEYMQETTYSQFKDFGGIKKAAKHEVKRDGNTFIEAEIIEFKALDKIEPDTFDEPK
jgi:hypothetical protein